LLRREDHQAAHCAAMIPTQEETLGDEILGHTYKIFYIFVTRCDI
jgi:hypothetical protein